jgi:hypothetical protein
LQLQKDAFRKEALFKKQAGTFLKVMRVHAWETWSEEESIFLLIRFRVSPEEKEIQTEGKSKAALLPFLQSFHCCSLPQGMD